MSNLKSLLRELVEEVILDEAKKKKKSKSKKSKKRPGRPQYYQGINKKGQSAMAKEINKCSPKGKPKGWKMPKSCYDSEWEADKSKYKEKK